MDRFELAVHGGSHTEALARARTERALVIGVESDMLFAIDEQERLAHAFEKAGVSTTFAPLQCIEGHDSFLIDYDQFGSQISPFLAR
jgi:homoserine acetyltransferase